MPRIDNPSVQLYTVREALNADFAGTLARLAEIGYRQVEPFNLVAMADDLKVALLQNNLSAPTTHMSLLSGADQDQTFTAAQDLGVRIVIDPHTDPAKWQTEEDIADIAAGLNSAAEKALGYELLVGYHNHQFELESRIDGRHGLEVLADHLAPEVVLEVDTYWAYAGGADVPELLRRLGDRVVALHVKDGDGSLDTKKQVAVGSGSLPVWDFLAAAPAMEYGVIELDDTTGDVFQAVADSYAFVTGKAA